MPAVGLPGKPWPARDQRTPTSARADRAFPRGWVGGRHTVRSCPRLRQLRCPALAEAPVLAHVTRGGVVESVHRASVAVTASDGSVLQAWGDPHDPVFPRSSNKPLQSVAMVRAGLDLPPHHLALASASHSAEPFHLDAVREMLAAAGLTEADLQNTPDLPYDPDERDVWIAAGHAPRSLAQNCSGKHAAMLATCRVNGWDIATYRDPRHPLQQLMAQTIADLAGEPVAAIGRRRVRRAGHGDLARRSGAGVRSRGRSRADHGRGARRRRDPPAPRVPGWHPARRHGADPGHPGCHRQGRRRGRVRRGVARRPRGRPEDRRRWPAGPPGRAGRGPAPPGRGSPARTSGSSRPRSSVTGNRWALSWRRTSTAP
jgi:hypothetical protein